MGLDRAAAWIKPEHGAAAAWYGVADAARVGFGTMPMLLTRTGPDDCGTTTIGKFVSSDDSMSQLGDQRGVYTSVWTRVRT